jgi:hypothetical protein
VTEYVCPQCGNTVERDFRVPSVVRTCETDGFVHHVRADLLSAIEAVPASARPDDWAELPGRERLMIALREGVVDPSDLRG